MGLNLADIGLVSQGYNAAADAERARQQQIQDRAYQLEQRRREEERQVAAQQEFERQQAFLSEARSTIPTYLAGGANAMPAQAAQPAVELDPRQQEGGDMPLPATQAQPAQDNLTGLYKALGTIAMKHGQLDAADTMKKRFQTADQEGVIDFIRKSRQGASDQELMDTFNASGNVRLRGLRKVDDGVYAGVTTDGKPVQFDVERMSESLLNPKDLLAHLDKTQLADERLKAVKARTDANAEINAARAEAARAQAGLADSKAAKVDEGADGTVTKPRGAGNWNAYNTQVRAFAKDALTEIDEDTGKPKVDPKNVLKLSTLAMQLAKKDPTLSPQEAITAAQGKMDEIAGIQAQSQQQAEEESKAFSNPTDRKKYVSSRAKALTKMREGNAAAAESTPGASAQQPAVEAGSGTFNSPEDVRAAWRSGRISRDQAKAELQKMGYQ